jgi:dTDP-4-dehydrorhamnose reductase
MVGDSGSLAVELSELLRAKNIDNFALPKNDRDITKLIEVHRVVSDLTPDVIINTAAFTNVDGAESKEETATLVNASVARNVAEVCSQRKIKMIQISTDYVFSGDAISPCTESAAVNPKTAYGRSKALGEKYVSDVLPDASWIIRTAWLYGNHGNNFVNTMLRLEKQQKIISVVDDQFGQPTWTKDLVGMIVEMVHTHADPGIYHGTNSGQTTWFKFACKIFELGNFDS